MEDELLPPPPKKGTSNQGGDDLLPPPPKKEIVQTSPKELSAEDSKDINSKQDIAFAEKNRKDAEAFKAGTDDVRKHQKEQQNANWTPEANGGLPEPIQKKLGQKNAFEYVGEQNTKVQKAISDIEQQKTNFTKFDYSKNFKEYVELGKQIANFNPNEAPDYGDIEPMSKSAKEALKVEHQKQYSDLIKKSQELAKQPFDLTSSNWDEVGLTADQLKAKKLPKDMQHINTVGDALKFWNDEVDRSQKLTGTYKEALQDRDEVINALRDTQGIKLDSEGYHELNQGMSYLNGLNSNISNIGLTFSLIGASDKQKIKIYNEQVGKGIVDPVKPTGTGAEFAQTLGELTPYFIPGVGLEMAGVEGTALTVGHALTNAFMMGANNYSQAGVEAYKKAYEESGGNEQLALQKANQSAAVGGVTGVAIGGIGLPAFEKVGSKIGTSLLSEYATKEEIAGAIKNGSLDASKLSIDQHLLYSLPKSFVANMPFYAGKVIGNKFKQLEGDDKIGLFDGAAQEYFGAVMLGSALDHLVYGSRKLTDAVKGPLENALAKYGAEKTQETLTQQVDAGNITKQKADEIIKPIEAKATAYKMMPENLTIDQQNLVLPLVTENNALLKKVEGSSYPDQASQAKIEANNRKILEITEAPLTDKEKDEMSKLKADEKANGGKLSRIDRDKLTHFEKRLDAIDATKKAKEPVVEKKVEEPKLVNVGQEQLPLIESEEQLKALPDKTKYVVRENGEDVIHTKETPKTEEKPVVEKEQKSVLPKPEEVAQHIDENHAAAKAEIDQKLKDKTITREEARKQLADLQKKATKELVDKRSADSKANKEQLKPVTDKFDEYDAIKKKKGISRSNATADFIETHGEEGVAIKAVSDNWQALKKELEEKGILEVNCP